MTKREHKTKLSAVESLVSEDRGLMKSLLRELGQDPDRLLGEPGLDRVLLVDPENTLPFRVAGNLLSHCVMRTGCAHFGLLLGQRGVPCARCWPTGISRRTIWQITSA